MKEFMLVHIIGLLIECCAIVFLVLCITTDINDDLFLPLALGCTAVGSSIGLAIQMKARKKNKENPE